MTIVSNKRDGYVDSTYLRTAGKLFQPIKQRSYELLGELPGRRVLDIGCGSGLDTLAIASLVGELGTVCGIDFDGAMVAEGKAKAEHDGMGTRCQHVQGSAYALPYPDGYFDAVRSERLLMHLDDPGKMLDEATRVLAPGGVMVMVDTDWGSLSANTGADGIEQRLVRFRAEEYLVNGYSGRRLYAQLQRLPLEKLHVETTAVHTVDGDVWRFLTKSDRVAELAFERGRVEAGEYEHWCAAMEQTCEQQSFFGSVNVVTIAAVKLTN